MSDTTDSGGQDPAAPTKGLPTVDRPGVEGATASTAGGPRLLVVDDRPELLKSQSEVVRLHGYQVTEALGGKAALDALVANEFDVVLLDLIMPDVSGHDVLDLRGQRGLDRKLIVVSGDASFDGVQHALTAARSTSCGNPTNPAELIATLEKALRQRQLEVEQPPYGRATAGVRGAAQVHRQQLARPRLHARSRTAASTS